MWLSGTVLDSELNGPEFNSHHRPDDVSLGKVLYSQFVYFTHMKKGVSGRIMMVFHVSGNLLVILPMEWRWHWLETVSNDLGIIV